MELYLGYHLVQLEPMENIRHRLTGDNLKIGGGES